MVASPWGKGIQEITQAEHISPEKTGDNIEAKRVASYESDQATLQWVRKGTGRTERYDYSDATTIYVGSAIVGTGEGSTGWTISKYDLTDTSNASGKIAIDVSWTNRLSGTFA